MNQSWIFNRGFFFFVSFLESTPNKSSSFLSLRLQSLVAALGHRVAQLGQMLFMVTDAAGCRDCAQVQLSL